MSIHRVHMLVGIALSVMLMSSNVLYTTSHSLKSGLGVVNGNDGPKEPAAYYLVGGDAASFDKGSSEMVQENKAFAPEVLSVPVGSTITFPNKDSFVHNVYSPKGSMGFFDLGSATTTDPSGGNLITKEFTKEGTIEIACAVHPIMKAHLFIVPSKYHTASKDGTYTFSGVPTGTYELMVVNSKGATSKLKSITI